MPGRVYCHAPIGLPLRPAHDPNDSMQHCDFMVAPRWCVPVEPDRVVLENHVVVVTEGRILEVARRDRAESRYQPSAVIERPDHILIPGLVNAHTHAAMTVFRGIADDMPLERWLREGVWPAEQRWVSAELVRDGTALAIAEMLRAGTTCFADQYFYPEIVAETAVDLHMRAVVGTPVVDFPTAWAADAEEYISKGTELVHDPFAGHPLVSSCFAPHSTYALSDESLVDIRVYADQLDLPVQMHLHETAAEVSESVERTGMRPLARLDSLGLLNASLLAVHAVHLEDEEIQRMAEVGVSIAHCPRSNLKLGSGIARLCDLDAAGIDIGIGTDGAASNNVLDMLSELRTATLLAKARAHDAAAVPAHAALRLATLGSAGVLGLDGETGSIRPGKWADLVCVDLSALNSQPLYDPVSQLVYTARAEQVSDVWVAGRRQLDGGRLVGLDVDAILERGREWGKRLTEDFRQQ